MGKFDWWQFLELAKDERCLQHEAWIRMAIGRLYYAVFNSAWEIYETFENDKEGIEAKVERRRKAKVKKGDKRLGLHEKRILCLEESNLPELTSATTKFLWQMKRFRTWADYNCSTTFPFSKSLERMIEEAQEIKKRFEIFSHGKK